MGRKIGWITLLIMNLCLSGCDLRWARYSNREYGFSLILPRFWQKQEGLHNTIVTARSPRQGHNDKFQENITVTAGDLAQDVQLDILFEVNKEEIMRVLPGVKRNLSEGRMFAGRNEGKWFSFDNTAQDLSLRIITAVWLKKKRVYVISCSGQSEEFSKYEPTFKKVMSSLRIK